MENPKIGLFAAPFTLVDVRPFGPTEIDPRSLQQRAEAAATVS
jgi:hypothetical protein